MSFGEPMGCRWRCIGQASSFHGSSNGRWRTKFAGGFGKQRQSRIEFGRFLMIAVGSADEMQVWALYARDLGYVDGDTAERWRGEYREIAACCRAFIAAVLIPDA